MFENYAAEKVQGNCAKDFVGWTGVPPITVLFEYVLAPENGIDEVWYEA